MLVLLHIGLFFLFFMPVSVLKNALVLHAACIAGNTFGVFVGALGDPLHPVIIPMLALLLIVDIFVLTFTGANLIDDRFYYTAWLTMLGPLFVGIYSLARSLKVQTEKNVISRQSTEFDLPEELVTLITAKNVGVFPYATIKALKEVFCEEKTRKNETPSGSLLKWHKRVKDYFKV